MLKINLIGKKYLYTLRKDDTNEFVEVEFSKSEYEDLAKEGAVNPTRIGYTFFNAMERNKYDTVDGDIHEGEYADMGDGKYHCKLPVKGEQIVDSKDFDTTLETVKSSKLSSITTTPDLVSMGATLTKETL